MLSWPPKRQQDAVEILEGIENQDSIEFQLTDEQLAEVRRRRSRYGPEDADPRRVRQKAPPLRHMRIIVRQEADDDLDAVFAWIAKDNPGAAADMIRRIRSRIGLLTTPGLAHIGRPGRDDETRELIELPYIIVYEAHADRELIDILAVFHNSQERR